MKEFGSDFHYIKPFVPVKKTLSDYYPYANYYADGRQAIIHLCQSQGWDRIWIPEYYCSDVIKSLKEVGLDVVLYTDYPGYDDDITISAIHSKGYLRNTDAILRVNFFGLRSCRCSEKLFEANVIEDHTHDLIGEWALKSSADWCIASLRKTLPVPEGGILWSPKGLTLPIPPKSFMQNEKIASIRWNAMKQKERYLNGDDIDKSTFRSAYVDTEAFFDTCGVCALDEKSSEYLFSFDISYWYKRKYENWSLLRDIHYQDVKVLLPENSRCYPFSLVLVFSSCGVRERVRRALIDSNVYPAVLWNIPSPADGAVLTLSNNMLSIHCDARYSLENIKQLKLIIQKVIKL